VLGLANPGSEYVGTRHNVGGAAVELLCRRFGVSPRTEKGTHARVAAVEADGRRVVFAIAETYMNESGLAAQGVVSRFLDGDATHLLVVHDELDLAPGVVRVKVGGGTAGHNGLRSINQHLKRLDFCRVRIGIGKPPSREHGVSHVLAKPARAEAELVALGIELAADAVELIISEGPDQAMTTVNARQ
jgi:peptidyl-tRNA hydrolase, PTH1 family